MVLAGAEVQFFKSCASQFSDLSTCAGHCFPPRSVTDDSCRKAFVSCMRNGCGKVSLEHSGLAAAEDCNQKRGEIALRVRD